MYKILVRKKNGTIADFDPDKIKLAATKALMAVMYEAKEALPIAERIANLIQEEFSARNEVSFAEIHDAVELHLMDESKQAAKAYILYRREREKARGGRDELIDAIKSITKEASKDNANIHNSPASKIYQMASEISKYYTLKYVMPKEMAKAHESGLIHINDLDYYSLTYNCLTFDLKRLLTNGFTLPHGFIRTPKTIMSAAALAAVLFQSGQNQQFGGIAVDRFDEALAPWAKHATDREIEQAMEAFIFNLNTLHSRAGNQVVFSSVTGGLGIDNDARRIWSAFLKMYDKGLGKGEQPMFPNIIVKVKEGINWAPEDPNYDLLLQALDVSSRRMNPTYIFLDSSFNKPYGLEASAMGCRTRVVANRHGTQTIAGRGNIAFVGINLPRLALEAEGDVKRFYRLLTKTMKLCEVQLLHRYNILKKLYVKDIPFIFGQGVYMGSENLKPLDTIEPALKNGTLSYGWIGLAEALTALVGKHHGESIEAQKLGIEIVSFMRKFADESSERNDLNFSLIASPAEGLAGRFIQIDKKLYGEIPGVTDKEYYTNSFHCPVGFKLDAYKKIEIEAPYHALTNAGHISYVELGEAPVENIEGLYKLLDYMKRKDMGYIGFNYPIDYCNRCNRMGYFPDTCIYCESSDIKRIRRITGYFSTEDRFNSGKLAELKDRVTHFGTKED